MSPAVLLTQAMLDEFIEFRGDMLAYVNSGTGTLKFDWDIIGELLQQVFLVRAGLASATFQANTANQLRSIVADEQVQRRLWDMAGEQVVQVYGKVVI
jgi:hypothetical protein